MRRLLIVLVVLGFVPVAPSTAAVEPPLPEPGFLPGVPVGPCEPDDAYEAHTWEDSIGAYGEACRRLRFVYGPVIAKPGQNDTLLSPVTIEKPWYAGYMVRFKPDLVDHTGTAPGVEEVHLHHGVWLSVPDYGNGPFAAAGEEKTIKKLPAGYGMRVDPYDQWLLLYMVHNTTPQPKVVWITYEVDFVAAADAAALGIQPVRPLWLDVQQEAIAPGAYHNPAYPVFNVQRGFGSVDEEAGQRTCTWPKENCARHDPWGGVTPQQGVGRTDIPGADWQVPSGFDGTIVWMGSHLHPGGLRNEVELVRDDEARTIFVSDAVYWDRADPTRAGGPPNSWDFAMTHTAEHLGWSVRIRQGDVIRLNAVYDSERASWYENMGIVVAFVAVGDDSGADVFAPDVTTERGIPTTARNPEGWLEASCEPGEEHLCLRGQVTHEYLPETRSFGGCQGDCPDLPEASGPEVRDIVVGGFTFGVAEQGVGHTTGIPRVRKGQPVRFWNADTGANIWHTVTRCAEPCTGGYGLDYPTADGGAGPDDAMDFDSTQIGYGTFLTGASGHLVGYPSNQNSWAQLFGPKPVAQAVQDGLLWEFEPTETGVVSFYCRVHPQMRGAIEVVDE